jgi:hypothetical protein
MSSPFFEAGAGLARRRMGEKLNPYLIRGMQGDASAYQEAAQLPGLSTDIVMQLGQWSQQASEAQKQQAAAAAAATADFTTNYLAMPYDQQVSNWGAVQAFAKEQGVEAPSQYNRDFLNYYALRSSKFMDTLKKSGPQLAGGAPIQTAGPGGFAPGTPTTGGGMAPLAAVGKLETGGLAAPADATSPKGAMGQYQIMTKDAKTGAPGGTAAEIAQELGDKFALDMLARGDVTGFEQYVRTPEINQQYGDHYLKKMTQMFATQAQQLGVPPEVLGAAAYNAGPGRVGEALSRSGGTLEGFVAALPAETQQYLMGNQNTGRQGFLSLTGAGGAAPGGGAGSPSGPAPAGGAPAGLRMVLGENGQPLSAGEGRVWFAPPDANGAPDWSRAVAQDPAGGAGLPQTTGLPTGYQWGKDAQGNAVAVPIPGLRAEGEKQPATFNQEDKLRDEFTAQTKLYREIESSYSRIKAAAGGDSGQDDIAIIFAYMKMLDPTSVVREGEFATAEATAGIPEQIVQAYNKALQGERLSPEMRQGFLSAAERQMEAAGTMFDQTLQHYQGLAQSYGLDPNRIVRPRGDKPDPGGATSGTVNGVQWKVLD